MVYYPICLAAVAIMNCTDVSVGYGAGPIVGCHTPQRGSVNHQVAECDEIVEVSDNLTRCYDFRTGVTILNGNNLSW